MVFGFEAITLYPDFQFSICSNTLIVCSSLVFKHFSYADASGAGKDVYEYVSYRNWNSDVSFSRTVD